MLTRKRLSLTLSLLAAGTLLTGAALAQEQPIDNRPNVYGGVSNYIFDDNWDQDDDFGWVFGGEAPLGERWGLTLEQYNIDSNRETFAGDADYSYTRLGGNYHLNPMGMWQPYLSLGLGYSEQDNSIAALNDPDEESFDFGIGTKRFFTDNLFLRGDAKAIRVTSLGNWDFALALSVGYAFGPKPQAAAPVQEAAVDPDSDGDGVPDSRDKCPNTPRELAVDADGCPIMDSSMLSQELVVEFDFDQADIKAEYFGEISDFAQFMTTYSNTNVVIEGHTDSVGTEEYNQGLSERRAQAVVARLVSAHGIAASRLSAVGYGESRPVVPNTTAENRARNRRIMAEVSVQVEEERRR